MVYSSWGIEQSGTGALNGGDTCLWQGYGCSVSGTYSGTWDFTVEGVSRDVSFGSTMGGANGVYAVDYTVYVSLYPIDPDNLPGSPTATPAPFPTISPTPAVTYCSSVNDNPTPPTTGFSFTMGGVTSQTCRSLPSLPIRSWFETSIVGSWMAETVLLDWVQDSPEIMICVRFWETALTILGYRYSSIFFCCYYDYCCSNWY